MSADNSENWVLGITLGLLGSIAINTGNNIQSLGLKGLKDNKSLGRAKTVPVNENGESADEANMDEPSPCSSSMWIIGTCIFVSGSLLNFASYAFAAQSMLASLESVQFVTNLLFGKFMLKAQITRRMIVGTMLTVLGTVVAVQFSSKTTLELDTAEMVHLYKNPGYIAYLVLMLLSMVSLSCVYRKYKKRKERCRPLPRTEIILPLCYSVWSALCGTQSVVQAKILAELLAVQTSGTENVFRSKFLYVTLVLWFISAWVWLSRLNKALSQFDLLLIIPLLQCSFIFFAILSGGIFFKEFDTFSLRQWCGFWSGVFIMFLGLRLLTPVQDLVQEGSARRISIGVVVKDESSLSKSRTEDFIKSTDESIDKAWESSVCLSTPPSKDSSTNDQVFRAETEVSCPADVDTNWPSASNVTLGPSRKKRQSLTAAAIQALRETIVDSTQSVVNMSSIVLLTPPNGSAMMTKALIAAREEKEKQAILRQQNLDRLSEILAQHADDPRRLLSHETFALLRDLGIDTGIKSGPGLDVEAMKHFVTSASDFRKEILRQMFDILESESARRRLEI
jgi:drug/metabolite transporter (DMT)-like permease